MLAEEVSGTASEDQGRIDSHFTSQAKKEIKNICIYIHISVNVERWPCNLNPGEIA